MPSPTSALSTQRPDLAASLEEFDLMMDAEGFIGHRALPVTPVASQAGSFGKIPIEQLLQNRETSRAAGSGYNRGNWEFEPATYATEEHGLEEPVDDREAAMYANYFDAEGHAGESWKHRKNGSRPRFSTPPRTLRRRSRTNGMTRQTPFQSPTWKRRFRHCTVRQDCGRIA